MKLLLIIAVIFVGALAYGHWHASNHASFYVSLNVEGEADYRPAFTPEANVQFLDPKGRVLATGVRDQQYNFLHLVHPTYGDCREIEKMAAFSKEARTSWQECFEHQSTWIAKWIGDVDRVNVKIGSCLIQNSPIFVSQSSSDWYWWWVPHPHIGGKPYTDYSAMLTVNKEDCAEDRP